MDAELIFQAWTEDVWQCWLLAKGERLGELRGKYVRKFDERGLHPFSMVVSQVWSWERLMPELSYAQFDPVLLRREAQREADKEFRNQVLEETFGQRDRIKGRADTRHDRDGGTEPSSDLAF
jgi:hypothetical protein